MVFRRCFFDLFYEKNLWSRLVDFIFKMVRLVANRMNERKKKFAACIAITTIQYQDVFVVKYDWYICLVNVTLEMFDNDLGRSDLVWFIFSHSWYWWIVSQSLQRILLEDFDTLLPTHLFNVHLVDKQKWDIMVALSTRRCPWSLVKALD